MAYSRNYHTKRDKKKYTAYLLEPVESVLSVIISGLPRDIEPFSRDCEYLRLVLVLYPQEIETTVLDFLPYYSAIFTAIS